MNNDTYLDMQELHGEALKAMYLFLDKTGEQSLKYKIALDLDMLKNKKSSHYGFYAHEIERSLCEGVEWGQKQWEQNLFIAIHNICRASDILARSVNKKITIKTLKTEITAMTGGREGQINNNIWKYIESNKLTEFVKKQLEKHRAGEKRVKKTDNWGKSSIFLKSVVWTGLFLAVSHLVLGVIGTISIFNEFLYLSFLRKTTILFFAVFLPVVYICVSVCVLKDYKWALKVFFAWSLIFLLFAACWLLINFSYFENEGIAISATGYILYGIVILVLFFYENIKACRGK